MDASRYQRTAYVIVRRISFSEGTGGLERAAALNARLLNDLGFRVHVITAALDSPPTNVPTVVVPWPRALSNGGGPTFGWAYRQWTKSVAGVLRIKHTANRGPVFWHGSSAASLRYLDSDWRSRSILNPHGMEEFRPSLLRAPNRLILRNLTRVGAQLSKATIATDSSLAAEVSTRLRISEDQVVILPNVVDVDLIKLRSRQADPIQADFVSCGRLVYNKGFDLLANALVRAARMQDKRITWVHFGRGPQEITIRRIVARSDVNISLTIIPNASDALLYATMAKSDAFIVPSRYEGSSITTLEAMALGVPVIATPVGGIPDKISDGVDGYLAESPTVEDLFAAIARRMRSTKDDSNGIAQAAYERVYRDFGLHVARTRYRTLLSRLPS